MLGTGRDYVSLDATGDNDADFARMQAISDAIAAALGDRASHRVRRLGTEEQIEEAMRDPKSILEASGGKLPVLLVNITEREVPLGPDDLDPLVARLGLVPVHRRLT